jgi:hypothetical protein
MIIQICGTNGSGKSTIVDKVFDLATDRQDIIDDNTGKTRGYEMFVGSHPLVVPGMYHNITARGCDAIKDMQYNLETVRQAHLGGYHVLFEGIRMMNHTRGLAFFRELGYNNLTLLLLDTPLAECVRSIMARRVATGKDQNRLALSKDIEGTITRSRNYAAKLRMQGARLVKVSRDSALDVVLEALK